MMVKFVNTYYYLHHPKIHQYYPLCQDTREHEPQKTDTRLQLLQLLLLTDWIMVIFLINRQSLMGSSSSHDDEMREESRHHQEEENDQQEK